MATRSLTRLFISFRNTSVNNATREPEYKIKGTKKRQADDTVALVSDEDLELGKSMQHPGVASLPPEWSDAVEEVQYDISKIKKRTKDLNALHNKHLNRPSLDDNVNEEHTIDVTTQEITQLFHQCQRCIQTIQAKAHGASKSEQTIVRNVVSTLASQLQELSISFKKGQSIYLKKMKNREEREKKYFNNDFQPTNAFMQEEDENFDDLYDKGFTTAQLQMVEENEQIVRQREEEISHIVRSIGDLNTIFKDLAMLIVDQGTILDRIDYNVEQASVQVEKGLQQLQKSEKHQKSSRKMLCILVLAVVLIIMIIALVLTKK
ncbi:syntaxin-16-like [Hydractinia symbiolongicarpus]|uniref:syntaxin-16-like n=1 Tax=Hydractinia symbiolongicarpus TaxID=13093 RepID=UPI00254C9598|nr:syntaxin-16-like [Hydractinia symbiolongicarpus]